MTTTWLTGGIESHLLNLARLLVENGADVTLAVRVADGNGRLAHTYRHIPAALISTPFSHGSRNLRMAAAWAVALWPLRMRRKFDLLYSIGPTGRELTRFTAFLAKFVKREGYVLANRVGCPAQEPLIRGLKSLLNGFIAETSLQAEAARRCYELEVPVAAIPCLSGPTSAPPRDRGLGDEVRVTFLGRYIPEKGIYRLLKIWPELCIGRARLDYYGDGPERHRLEEQVRQRGLATSVRVNGPYGETQLAEVLASSDLVVLPSETEGLPTVLVESMAHGVPFVATDVGAVRALAEDNPDVRVVPLDDAALKHGIVELVGALRAGQVSGARLQTWHARRYGYERVSRLWLQALLGAERFWAASDPANSETVLRGVPACALGPV
jgi:glycosyltransferase involved in cell wall biosynthesis